MGLNPFDWLDDIGDAAGETWDSVTDTFQNLVFSKGKTIFDRTPGGEIARKAVDTAIVEPSKIPTRTLAIGADFPLEILNNTMAFGYNNAKQAQVVVSGQKETGFKKAKASTLEQLVGIIGNTTVAQVLKDSLPGGDKLDVGSGFLPGGETVREQRENKKELYPTIYGSTFTVGRMFGGQLADNGVIEPGTTSYNVISGAIDAAWTIGADPFNWIPAGAVTKLGDVVVPLTAGARAGKRAKVATTLSKKAESIIKKAAESGEIVMDAAGLIDNGRRSVNPNNWEAFKLTPDGKKWLESFAGDTSGSGAEIWRASGGQIPPGTAVRLQKAENLDEVVAIMDEAVYGPNPLTHVRIMPGIDPRPIVSKVGATIKGNASRYRAFGDTLPESTDFPLNNPLLAIKNADSVMGVLQVDLKTRNGLLDEIFEIMEGTDDKAIFDWLDKFENEVVASQLRQWNYSTDEIKRISSWRQKYEESISSFATDSAGSSVPLQWLVGGPRGGYGPLLISQQLKVNPVLIDPVDLREIADRLGPIRSRLEKSRRQIIETSIDPDTGVISVDETRRVLQADLPARTIEATGDLVDYMTSRVWKPNILMRPKYLVKVLPEEMLRVSAAGVFDHPFQYIAQIFTNKSTVDIYGRMITTTRRAAKLEAQVNEGARVIRKYEALKASGQTTYKDKNIVDLIVEKQLEIDDLTKELEIFDERIGKLLPGMDDALLRGSRGKASNLMLNPSAVSGMMRRGNLISVERAVDPNLWSKAMAQRLAERASNGYIRSIAQALLDGKSVDQITNRFVNGDLKQFLDRYIKDLGNANPDYVWDFNGVRNFVIQNINDINIYTFNGNETLLKAIAQNRFMDEGLSAAKGFQGLPKGGQAAKYEPNKLLKKFIKDTYADDPSAPVRVNYFPSVFDTERTIKTQRDRMTARYDAFLNLFWDGMYGASSDKLARNPLWSQAKWQRVVELVPVMNRSEALQLADTVAKSKLPKTLKEDIIELAQNASGEMNIDDVEFLGELYATRFTKEQLFDASRKTNFGATHRKIFPFYDAFVELTGSALKLATNPKIVHRADKILGEFRDNTFLGSDIDGDGKKESFLYSDPVSGDEMFAFAPPGSWLSEWKKRGLDFKFGNTLKSLSIITTPYPGLSPMVALPFVKILPDAQLFDKLKDLIAPYGIPDLTDPSILQFVIPGATDQVQRILGSNGLEAFAKLDDREKLSQATIRALQIASTVKDYDPATPGIQGPTGYDSLEEWQDDGKELGLKIWGLTGWAGLFMPGAPIAQWSAKTKQGSVLISVISQRWNQIDTEGDKLGLKYQDKIEQFVEEFGSENMVAFLQPITDRAIAGSNSSKEYSDWYRQNKNVVDKYETVGGYFSPRSGEIDPDVWNIQKIAGDVNYKDPEVFAKNVESAVANFIFNRNLRAFEDTIPPAERGTKAAENAIKAERSRLSKGIEKAYPNWDRASSYTQNENQRKIQFLEIRKFVDEPSQQENPVVKAAKEYLDFRDQNLAYIMSRTTKINEDNWKTMTANKAAITLRGVLWEEGERLAEQYPAFVNLWQNIMSREFRSVDIEE